MATLLGVLGALALPGVAGAQEPARDSVVGSVQTTIGLFPQISAILDARSGPQGEDPTGSVELSGRTFLVQGPVTCLTVTGNRATIGVGLVGGGGALVSVEDNGTPGAGRDRLEFALFTQVPSTCPPNTIVFNPDIMVSSGDLTVLDAQPLPTAKDQCKNGGWRNYASSFKNQGQCVAFVQRGPKP